MHRVPLRGDLRGARRRVLLLAAGMSEGTPASTAADELARAVEAVPGAVREALEGAGEWAEEQARRLLSSRHLYVLGSGPLAPLAYKVALTVVMENIRIGGTWCDASEWRHGPAEALERSQVDALMLIGTDASRPMCERTLAFLREHGARTLAIDAAAHATVHPLLTPFVLNTMTQWFTVWSAVLRGITDLDDRVFMGRQVLAEGGTAGRERGRLPRGLCLDVYVPPVGLALVGGSCLNVAVGLRGRGSRRRSRVRSATTRRASACSRCSPSADSAPTASGVSRVPARPSPTSCSSPAASAGSYARTTPSKRHSRRRRPSGSGLQAPARCTPRACRRT